MVKRRFIYRRGLTDGKTGVLLGKVGLTREGMMKYTTRVSGIGHPVRHLTDMEMREVMMVSNDPGPDDSDFGDPRYWNRKGAPREGDPPWNVPPYQSGLFELLAWAGIITMAIAAVVIFLKAVAGAVL